MHEPLSDAAMDQLFLKARTQNDWLSKAVSDDMLEKIWDIARMGPTSANCSPVRVVFAKSKEAKEKLRPCLMKGNIAKTMAAPVTAIIGYDLDFFEQLPKLFPHTDARSWFAGNDALIEETAFRNSTLQAAYLLLAARSLGLDCGPMSGFDNAMVDTVFFAGTNIRSNFLCNLGYGSDKDIYPRSPRLSFAEACQVA